MSGIQLSVDLISIAASALRPDPRADLEHEARLLPRFKVWGAVQIVPGGERDSAQETVWVRDLSRGGIGFLCSAGLDLPDRFVVLLPQRFAEPLRIRCVVAHRHELVPGVLSVGANFRELLPVAALM